MIKIVVIILIAVILSISCVKVIKQSKVGIVMRLGKFQKKADTGVHFLIPFLDKMAYVIDLRENVVDFPPQPVITKDNVTMQIDTVVYFQVTDPVRYVFEIANPISAIENLTATTLRNIIGELDLDETLTSRDLINTKMRSILDEATDKWGIKVNRVELKNIMPPQDIQVAMEKQMRAERERRESILQAEGEKQSSILKAEGEKQSAILKAEAKKEADEITKRLLELVAKDAEVFEPLSKAYSLPKSTPEELAKKEEVMAVVLKDACEVPLEIMKTCARGLDLMKECAEKGSRIALSDAGVGATLLKSALQGASLNIYINTKSMKDRVLAQQLNDETDSL